MRLDQQALLDAECSGTSLFLFSSQCGGYLAKQSAGKGAKPSDYHNPACVEVARRITEIANGAGVTPTNVAVAFLLGFSPNIFPIIGPRSVVQLRDSMEASRLRLTPDQITEIATICGFENWRLASDDAAASVPLTRLPSKPQ